MPALLWIFEDQLSMKLTSLESHQSAPVLMVESRTHLRDWGFHKMRLAHGIAAMRHFADELKSAGRDVHYYPLKPRGYRDSVSALKHALKQTSADTLVVVDPSEHHTRAWVEQLAGQLNVELEILPNKLFLIDRHDFADWARSKKAPVMEPFYRRMRKQHDVLMDGKDPECGEWNLDKENRDSPPVTIKIPKPRTFKPDDTTRQALKDVEREFPNHPGQLDGFDLPVTRNDARNAFDDFIKHRLEHFGRWEDAMVEGEPLVFHSGLSHLFNCGLLDVMECIRAAEKAYRDGKAPLNSVEGFIRQLLGWREYVYGIYHAFMPKYRDRNGWKMKRELPQFFWTGDCEMNCLKQSIGNVVEHAYSHHIQRLMVICNFATLCGLSPQAVNDWFYAMYIDSWDWVVTPNVIGMGMNADGGTMATKPYVSSGSYINRMSDYCAGCKYKVKQRTGEQACPFNYLFWTFLDEHREQLDKNVRMKMMLKNLDKLDKQTLDEMYAERESFLKTLYNPTK